MGFRARKSIQVVPGVRLNLSKTGVGMSVGVGPGRYSVHSSGRETISARTGFPGVYYQKSVSGRSHASAEAAAAPAGRARKPGLFAPKGEKKLYTAIRSQDAEAIEQVGQGEPAYRLPAYSIAGLMMIGNEDTWPEAKQLLSAVFADGRDPAGSPFTQKYLASLVRVSIAPGISTELPINRDAVGLALAELHQRGGAVDEAINVVEQLEPSTYAAISLAELYVETGRYDNVVDLTEDVSNQDDASALLLVYRAVAFREQGYLDAANEAFREALKSRSRAGEVRHLALSERATNYLQQGKKAQARKDLERILAEDSGYEGVRERLSELS
jgi:tetratricopeptide (TPR) repeat protein